MRSFVSLARFELRYQALGPTFIISFAVFFLLSFFSTASTRVSFGIPPSVLLNAPSAIAMKTGILTLVGTFLPAVMLSSAIIRDREFKTEEMFHSTPLSPKIFVLGRLSGGLLAVALAFASVPLGIYLATLL
ncbi:MAG: hypothetical protein AAFY60_02040, partial [Myxococcota bacterium]